MMPPFAVFKRGRLVFPQKDLDNLDVVSGAVDNVFGPDGHGVHVQSGHIDCGPENHQAGDPVFPDHDVFHMDQIKNPGPGFDGLGGQGGGGLDGIGGVIFLFIWPGSNTQFVQQRFCFVLHHDFVEHHPSAPHAAANG